MYAVDLLLLEKIPFTYRFSYASNGVYLTIYSYTMYIYILKVQYT